MKYGKTKRIIAFVLALAVVFVFAACGQADDVPDQGSGTGNSTSQPAGGAAISEGQDFLGAAGEKPEGIQPGTVFNYSMAYDTPSYMPWMDSRGMFLAIQVFDNLLYKHHQDQNDIRGNLAESWEVSDDGLIWVFKIKENAYFTSGNQVDAEAFVKSWDAAREYQPRFFAPVEHYEATGKFELTITLSSPSATFIYDLPMQSIVGVVDPEALEAYGPEDNRAAIGAGPYYIDSYISGSGFVLKANPNYHNPDRAPSVETVNFNIIPDENTALIALLNGELDAMVTLNIEIYNNLIENGMHVAVVEDRAQPYWMNLREVEIFRDPVVREALCHMIDWQAVTDLAYDGLFPIPDSYWAGPGGYTYNEKYTYDPELGTQMLEDAGYSKDDIAFKMLGDGDYLPMEVAVQGQFQALGFNNVEVETLDGATCYGMLKSGTYEVFPMHNGYGVESPLTAYTMGLIPDGTQRVMWLEYADEEKYAEAMQYYEAALHAPDFDTYIEAVAQITRICQEECLAFGSIQSMRFYGISDQFGGVYIAPVTGYVDFCYIWDLEAAAT